MVASRVLVTGSRDYTDEQRLRVIMTRIARVFFTNEDEPPILISGNARGADTLAEKVWESHGWPIERYPADWDTHGRSAGHIRNAEMAKTGADVCVAFPLGKSAGTRGMMKIAEKHGIPVVDTSIIREEDLK